MKKILIISATLGNNYLLSKNIDSLTTIDSEIAVLEDYKLPLYIPGIRIDKNVKINKLVDKFKESDGLIFCAPEYNGGSPPILTNLITWLSLSTNDWRKAFVEKKGMIATHSGGAGSRFLATFRVQLEHMGVIVYPRTIMVNKNNTFNKDSAKKILNNFQKLL